MGAVVFGLFLFGKYLVQPTLLRTVLGEPGNLVNRAMKSAKVSPRITRRTGEITAKNFKVEKLGARKDTTVFRFFMEGERADATIKLWMVKRPSGQWEVFKTDTLFSAVKTASAHARK
ncbi:hypothetical protein FY528_12685 [Hymenobacter lutimineralis]|uniref:Uncharacterized protein n=1 Tax=Hymenobacter lutimineralis TaxID=2606448 RepID=A0A5D6UXQ5_9BACT|nr:hypothetical protein [Hymenobacter lutimineralis]TYZ08306.1 hypothetical protein FY528_12685 [Hymenobacter lutimineralis]